jgi:hypothetical protein
VIIIGQAAVLLSASLRRTLQGSVLYSAIAKANIGLLHSDYKEIVVTLSRHLSWLHFLRLISLKRTEVFYVQKESAEMLGVRDLRKQIGAKKFGQNYP